MNLLRIMLALLLSVSTALAVPSVAMPMLDGGSMIESSERMQMSSEFISAHDCCPSGDVDSPNSANSCEFFCAMAVGVPSVSVDQGSVVLPHTHFTSGFVLSPIKQQSSVYRPPINTLA
ncbi:MAG: hypothetical protein HWD83_07580 [Gammaproteobacteria bacterium]|nr:hypothetical protein [Gammaproteobacteria bacterium]